MAEPSELVALHLCTRYQRGGSERRIRDVVAALPELRHELLLGAESDVELARAQTGASGVRVLPALVRQVSPRQDAAAAVALWRLLRQRRYAVVVTHQSKAGALGRTAAAAAGSLPVVHSLSMASFGDGYGRAEDLSFRMLERLLARGTAAYCVVGSDLADRFAAVGVPRRRLHVVRSAVPLPVGLPSVAEARARVAQRYLLPAAGPLLCYVGSLEPRKNVLRLADVLAQVRAAGVPASLLVVGEGPQRGQLEQRLRGLGVAAHAVLTGHLAEPARVHEALRAADVALLLSNAEGLPQVLVQAAATGTRFVAYDVEGVGELLSLGARGTAVPHGDLDGVVRAVVDHPRAADGREPVADLTSWSPETIRVAYRDVFEAVLPGGSLRPALPLSAPA